MIYSHKAFSVKILINTSEHIYQSEAFHFESTSVVMATIPDVQKSIDTKFKTLKLLEKDTPRIYERSQLNKQKLLYEKHSD